MTGNDFETSHPMALKKKKNDKNIPGTDTHLGGLTLHTTAIIYALGCHLRT